MKKKIIFGSILATIILLMLPCVSSVETQTRVENIELANNLGEQKWSRLFSLIVLDNLENYKITVEGEEVGPEDLMEESKDVHIIGTLSEDGTGGSIYGLVLPFIYAPILFAIANLGLALGISTEKIENLLNMIFNKIIVKLPGIYQLFPGDTVDIHIGRSEGFNIRTLESGLVNLDIIGFNVKVY